MKIEVINGNRKATPTNENNYLCNASLKHITDHIWLGVNDNATEWQEITEEEKIQLESEWSKEDFSEATEQDYQNALAEMGVDLNG